MRQINAILARVELDLGERGLDVSRHGVGGIHFKVPPPWRIRRAGLLGAATSGRVRVTAGRGEQRHVRYELKFTTLQAVLTLASFVLVIVGWQRARVELIATVGLIWLLMYLPAYAVANAQLKRIVAASAREVIERRRGDRSAPPGSAEPGSAEKSIDASSAALRTVAPPAAGERGERDAG